MSKCDPAGKYRGHCWWLDTNMWSLLRENQADLLRKVMFGLLGRLTSILAVGQGSFKKLFG